MTSASMFVRSAIAILAFVFTATAVRAEAPGKPIEFGATVVENGTMVKLSWMANRDGGIPTSFCIYIAEGETDNQADFELLKEDDFEPNPNGLYSYLVQDLEPGIYSFYIVAKNDDGTSDRSVIKVVNLKGSNTSGKPGKPIEFTAKVVEEGTMVKLLWGTNREGGWPDKFCIFIAEGETEDMDDFTLLAEVESQPNTIMYSYLVQDLEPGTYTFYVIAKNADGSSDRTPIKVVVLGNKPPAKKMFIVSKPKQGLKVGEKWTYEIEVEKNFEATSMRYVLTNGPDGMTIDEETGVVTWEEPREGRYVIRVCAIATDADGKEIEACKEFVIEVGDGENEEKKKCAVIVGTVKGDGGDNAPAMSGWVYAWSMEQPGNSGKDRERTYKAAIRQGTYVLELPAGTYRLQVKGEGFYSEWYEDVETADEATEVTVACDNTRNEVNFLVTFRPEPEMKTVCGTVYDAETNDPIQNALVVFESREDREKREDGEHKRAVAETDADGNYCVKLPAGYTYVAYAKARTPNSREDLYLAEWYNNTHDASEATGIDVTDNVDGIDFPMDKAPTYEGGFGGTMMDHATEDGVPGKVIAYMVKSNANGESEKKDRTRTVETDENGAYQFNNLVPGTYIVLGMPGERPYAPGWHVMGDVAAASWKDADRIEVADVMLTVQYDIRLDSVHENAGRGHLRGWVNHRGGVIGKSSDRIEENVAVAGAITYAYDAAGVLVDYAVSNESGAFVMTNLPIGTSNVVIDRFEFETASEQITIDLSSLETTVSAELIRSVTSVEVPVDRVGRDLNLYPNPATSTATISFGSVEGPARIQILSMSGVVLSSEITTVSTGRSDVTLNTANLPSGMVMVHVTNGATSFALPLQIVR